VQQLEAWVGFRAYVDDRQIERRAAELFDRFVGRGGCFELGCVEPRQRLLLLPAGGKVRFDDQNAGLLHGGANR
jgi:hypothetical protein